MQLDCGVGVCADGCCSEMPTKHTHVWCTHTHSDTITNTQYMQSKYPGPAVGAHLPLSYTSSVALFSLGQEGGKTPF